MMSPLLNNRLDTQRERGLTRRRYQVLARDSRSIVVDGKSLLNFCNNDYLGLATHPLVKRAFVKGVSEFGFGSSASAIVAGSYKPHRVLEDRFAEFLNREQALLFNSGYHANLGVITTLTNRHDTILSDKLCHASMLDAIQLSRASHLRFKHNDISHCEKRLNNHAYLVTESVFSIGGDIAPVDELARLAKQYQSTLIVDDAHGIGVLGKNGGGITEHFQLNQASLPCLITPLGKALGGAGAIVSGSQSMISTLTQFARTFYYSTALPPAIASGMIASLALLQKENWRITRLQSLIQHFIRQAKLYALPLLSDQATPIKSILVGDSHIATHLKEYLFARGFFVSCIRQPTVQAGQAVIRIALNAEQSEEDINLLLDHIKSFYEK